MNHIKLRRIALAAASVSLGVLTSLVLLGTSYTPRASAQGFCQKETDPQNIETKEQMTPISISCTPLVIENLCAYDGSFLEDGSGREVQDVASIMLYNSKDSIVPYAFVTVYTESCRYTFQAYMIPPKSSVLVPELNAHKLKETKMVRVFGWTTVSNEKQLLRLKIEEIGMGCLQVTNESGSKIHDLTLYHRTYIPEDGFYMGGTVFKTEIPYIAPGNTVTIYPSNFASGYSKVVYFE